MTLTDLWKSTIWDSPTRTSGYTVYTATYDDGTVRVVDRNNCGLLRGPGVTDDTINSARLVPIDEAQVLIWLSSWLRVKVTRIERLGKSLVFNYENGPVVLSFSVNESKLIHPKFGWAGVRTAVLNATGFSPSEESAFNLWPHLIHYIRSSGMVIDLSTMSLKLQLKPSVVREIDIIRLNMNLATPEAAVEYLLTSAVEQRQAKIERSVSL